MALQALRSSLDRAFSAAEMQQSLQIRSEQHFPTRPQCSFTVAKFMLLEINRNHPLGYNMFDRNRQAGNTAGSNILKTALPLMLLLRLFCAPAHGQELLTDTGGNPKVFLIEISGTVLNKTFSKARALLKLAPPNPGSINPYLVTIDGYAKTNERNDLHWNSDETLMDAFSSQVRCQIKKSFVKPPNIFFFYLSPALLGKRQFLTQHESERQKLAEKGALPTKVFASAGELSFTVASGEVKGSIWIKGYDAVEK